MILATEPAENERKQETAQRKPEPGIAGRATTPVGAISSACPDASRPALPTARDRGAGWPGKMDDFEALDLRVCKAALTGHGE